MHHFDVTGHICHFTLTEQLQTWSNHSERIIKDYLFIPILWFNFLQNRELIYMLYPFNIHVSLVLVAVIEFLSGIISKYYINNSPYIFNNQPPSGVLFFILNNIILPTHLKFNFHSIFLLVFSSTCSCHQ